MYLEPIIQDHLEWDQVWDFKLTFLVIPQTISFLTSLDLLMESPSSQSTSWKFLELSLIFPFCLLTACQLIHKTYPVVSTVCLSVSGMSLIPNCTAESFFRLFLFLVSVTGILGEQGLRFGQEGNHLYS